MLPLGSSAGDRVTAGALVAHEHPLARLSLRSGRIDRRLLLGGEPGPEGGPPAGRSRTSPVRVLSAADCEHWPR
jgi:hypothetical protein